jgi:hypothetical protein
MISSEIVMPASVCMELSDKFLVRFALHPEQPIHAVGFGRRRQWVANMLTPAPSASPQYQRALV